MWRTSPTRSSTLVVAVAVASVTLVLSGADKPSKLSKVFGGAETPKKKVVSLKVEETVGDIANIFGSDVKVEGVGLVMGLDGTGAEPAPSWQLKKLIDEMQKQSVEHPERLLKNTNYSMVVVRAIIPAGVSSKDKFDIEIELPPASATTSLAGGWLLETRLAQRVQTKEGAKDDKVIAKALGPILIGSVENPGDPKVGRVLGGGKVLQDSPYLLSIKEAKRSGKTSQLLENVIKQRFHQTVDGANVGMAVAKTDAVLILNVPKTYHHNQDRYHLVISHLNLIDNPALREQRLQDWGKDLLDPKKAGIAAIKLEGLGPVASPVLERALTSTDDTVRFFAAEALAYLNDGDGAQVLYEIAKKKPEFRSFALKAMAAMDQSASLLKLRALMNEPDYELRYGAFDALRTLDPTDPFLGRLRVMDVLPEPEKDDDMAVAIGVQSRRKPRAQLDEPFSLYVVDSEGPPLVHISGNMRCEIVVFGKGQKLLTPIVLGAGGPLLLNASDGDPTVQICKITSKTLDVPETKVNSPLEVTEIIREMANLGASYPDVVGVLAAASKQKNLPGPFAVDALPEPNPAYDQAQLADVASKKDDSVKKTSGDGNRVPIRQRIGDFFKR